MARTRRAAHWTQSSVSSVLNLILVLLLFETRVSIQSKQIRNLQFPFGPCSLHTHCGSCLNTEVMDSDGHPLRCGWCDSYCATEAECQTPTLFSRSRCPPEVFEFSPNSGPLSGGTRITIQGDNLGNPQSSTDISHIKIRIGVDGPNCSVLDLQPRRVQCITESVTKQFSAKLFVTVRDYSAEYGIDINGTAVSKEEFKYLTPELSGVYPSYGPIDGGTNVTLIGQNLHIGSNRSIFLAGVECKEVQNNSSFINCITGRVGTAPSKDMSVRLNIDSEALIVNQELLNGKSAKFIVPQWSEYFQYRPNPLIESYYPNHTIKSGNTSITVKGMNLNSVARPRLMVTARAPITNEEVRSEGNCQVNSKGTQMICWTPPIRDPIQPPRSPYVVLTQLSFVLDGSKNYNSSAFNTQKARLHYHPDPTYHNFEETVREVIIEEPLLKIDGRDLSSDYPIDITISDKYHVPCNTTDAKSFTELYCLVTYHEQLFRDDGEEHTVHIRVGRISFSPGRIRFVLKPQSLPLGSINYFVIISIMVIIVALVVWAVIVCTKKYLIGKRHNFTAIYTQDESDSDFFSFFETSR